MSVSSLNLRYCQHKPVRIVQRIIFGCAIVEPENLLVNVAVKVERFDGNIGAAVRA